MLEFMQRFFKKRYVIAVLVVSVLFGMLGETYNFLIKARQGSMLIEFNYPGSENGLNPDGSPFDISVLKSDEVLKIATEKLRDPDVDIDFLKSRIFITSRISSTMMDKVVSNVQKEKNNVYLPTTFYVYYSQKNKFSKNETALFMQSLADAYQEFFTRKYSEKNDILEFHGSDYNFEAEDYQEIYTTLLNKVDSMISFMYTHQKENRAFYSEDQVNMGTAIKRLESFRDISLEKFYANVVQNGISKDNVDYVKRIDYFLENKTLEYEKLAEASEIAKNVMTEYEPGITAVSFIPSVDSKNNYYMSRTKTGLDELTKRSYEDGMAASRVLKDIENYRNLGGKFSVTSATGRRTIETTDQMVDELVKELEDISEEVLKTDNEYLENKTLNYLKIRLPEGVPLINIRFIIKCGALGFILAALAITLYEMLGSAVRKRLVTVKDAVSSFKFARKNRR